MIWAMLLAAQSAHTDAKYQLCGASADTVAAVREQINRSKTFSDMPNGGDWYPRWNGLDMVWLFPKPSGGVDIAICRHLISDTNGVSMQTNVICDGSDQACEAARNRLIGPGAVNQLEK